MKQSINREAKAIEKYLEEVEVTGTAKTARNYRDLIHALKAYFGKKSLLDVTSDDLKKYIADLAANGRAAKTINTYISWLKPFYGFLVEYDYIERNPMNKVKRVNEPKALRKYLKDEQVTILFERASINPQFNFAVHMFFYTGIRVSELCNMKASDIDLNDDTLKVWGKGNKQRELGIPAKLRPVLISWLKANEISGNMPVWKHDKCYTDAKFRTLTEWCGFKVKPHTLRHTFATRLYRKTGDLGAVCMLLGHENIETTALYAKYDSNAAIMLQKANC